MSRELSFHPIIIYEWKVIGINQVVLNQNVSFVISRISSTIINLGMPYLLSFVDIAYKMLVKSVEFYEKSRK